MMSENGLSGLPVNGPRHQGFDTAGRAGLTARQRLFCAAETIAGIVVIVAHNAYRVIPNEVPILFIMALLSFRLREGRWGLFLYRKPHSWAWTLASVLLAFVLLQMKDALLLPLGQLLWPHEAVAVSSVLTRSHNVRTALETIAFVWVFAGLGEEVGYRGYLLRRACEALGPSRWGANAALLITAAAAGFGHFYKGPAGMLDSFGSAIILGCAYLFTRRLWVGTLTHGLNDTAAVLLPYLGW